MEGREWLFYAGALVALLPLIVFRDFTPDNELRYLSITDEALRNHDIFAFHNHGAAYADKPPLYFWFTMLCRLIAGRHCMWLLALGSLLPAFGVVEVMRRWTARLIPAKSEWTAMMALMSSAYFLGAAVILRMDMLMCLFIVLALRTFWKLYEGKGRPRDRWLFPLWLFLALFTKGPLGILIPLAGTLVFLAVKGKIRTFVRYWGWRTWTLLLGLCALWFLGVYADGGKEYLDNLLFHQTMDRAVNAFHHKRPFWYYAVAMWYVMAPWSLYVIGAVAADLRHLSRLPGLQQFFIAIGVTTIVLLSCISSKLQIYMLPAVPFLVYAAIMSLAAYEGNLLTRVAIGFPAAVFVLVLPAAIAGHFLGLPLTAAFDIAAALLTAGGIWGGILVIRGKVSRSVAVQTAALFAAIFALGWAVPDYREQIGYGAVCEKAAEVAEKEGIEKICAWKIRRPDNMDVYLGREVTVLEEDTLPDAKALGSSIVISRYDNGKMTVDGSRMQTVGPYVIIINK